MANTTGSTGWPGTWHFERGGLHFVLEHKTSPPVVPSLTPTLWVATEAHGKAGYGSLAMDSDLADSCGGYLITMGNFDG